MFLIKKLDIKVRKGFCKLNKRISFYSVFLFISLLAACNNTYEVNTMNLQESTQAYSSPVKTTLKDLMKELVENRFIFADKNKDKNLTFSEFKLLESEPEDVIKKMFDFYDENQDNIVSYNEFSDTDLANAKNGVEFLFGWLDTDGNTFIDFGVELDRVVKISKKEANDNGVKLTEEEVKKDFTDSDQNKDKKLNLEEFSLAELKYIVMIPEKESKRAPSLVKFLNNVKKYLGK